MARLDYRKAVKTDVWHWNFNCRQWPDKAFQCTYEKPAADELCKECGPSF